MEIDLINDLNFSFWIELGLSISAIVFAFLLGSWRQILKIRKKSNIDWNVHSQIHEFLTETRVKTKAARAQIVQFHNGEYFVDGVSMQKLSTTHESLANGVSSDMKTNTLITLYSPLLDKLSLNTAKLYSVEEEKQSYFRNALELANVHSYMALPIHHNGLKSGFIFLQWCSDTKSDYVEKHLNNITVDLIYARNIIEAKLSQQIKGK